ncbi:unnamed protein product [Mytilus coruscus]|uniref:Uncharacterized protein n=1 Tax=Mytilus coruscus TaxID=42192 RepID=A0A6J8CW60_MYTCO|nr:unnamed protein product [Mytilus coruscus]
MTSEKHALEGPDGANSMQTKHDISQLITALKSLRDVVNEIHVEPLFKAKFSLKSTSTTIVKNLFSEMRAIDDTPLMIQFARRFSNCVRELFKRITQMCFLKPLDVHELDFPKLKVDVQETVGTTVDIQETRNVIYSKGSTVCVFKLDIKGLPSSLFYIVIISDCYKMPDDAKFVLGKWFAQDKIHPLDFVESTSETSETFIGESVIEILLLDDFQAEDDVIVISEDSYHACMIKVCIGSDINDVTLQEEVEMNLEEESATNVARLFTRGKRKRTPRSDTDFMIITVKNSMLISTVTFYLSTDVTNA